VRRHPFDPVSLVFGLAFAAAAIIVLAGGELVDDGQILLPATLLGLGVALLVQNARRPRPTTADDGPHDDGHGPGYGYGTADPHAGSHDPFGHDARRDEAGTADPEVSRGAGDDPHDAHDALRTDAADPGGDPSGTSSDDIDWSTFAPDEPPRRGTIDWPGT
jgi:hypothetical protein